MRIFISHDRIDADAFAGALAEALRERGFEPVDARAFATDSLGALSAAISAWIRTSDLVVALLTPGVGPDVYFELGLAAGVGVPVVVAATGTEQLAADLASAQYVALTGEQVIDVAAIVRRVVDVTATRRAVAPDAIHSEAESGRTSMGSTRRASEELADAALDPAVIEALSPWDFEQLVARVFRERGFDVESQSGPDDQGIDLIVSRDPFTVVQVKRYRRESLVPVGAVRAVLGAMSHAGAERGILVSSSAFTRSAQAVAAEWPIDLMTIEDLLAMPDAGAHAGPDGS